MRESRPGQIHGDVCWREKIMDDDLIPVIRAEGICLHPHLLYYSVIIRIDLSVFYLLRMNYHYAV